MGSSCVFVCSLVLTWVLCGYSGFKRSVSSSDREINPINLKVVWIGQSYNKVWLVDLCIQWLCLWPSHHGVLKRFLVVDLTLEKLQYTIHIYYCHECNLAHLCTFLVSDLQICQWCIICFLFAREISLFESLHEGCLRVITLNCSKCWVCSFQVYQAFYV